MFDMSAEGKSNGKARGSSSSPIFRSGVIGSLFTGLYVYSIIVPWSSYCTKSSSRTVSDMRASYVA
jgi:hypothetical protein